LSYDIPLYATGIGAGIGIGPVVGAVVVPLAGTTLPEVVVVPLVWTTPVPVTVVDGAVAGIIIGIGAIIIGADAT